MQNHIRNTNLRFNLDKDQQRRAWEYLQTMDRQNFKSYSQVSPLHWSIILTATTALRLIPIWKQGNGRTFCETDCRSSRTQPETVIADFSVRADCRHVGKGIPHQDALSSS